MQKHSLLQSVLFLYWGAEMSPLSGGHDGIHHLDDSVQRRVSSNGHVCAAEVVVDGTDHADYVELRVAARVLLADQTWGMSLRSMRRVHVGQTKSVLHPHITFLQQLIQ